MDIVEQAKIRLVIDGKDAVNELQVIDAKITSLREKQKEYAKGTVEYKQLNGEIRELEKSYKLVEQRMDISKMTMQQLRKYQSDLNREIQQMDPASKAFENTSARIKEVSARQQELGGMVKGQQTLWEQFGGWIKGAFAVTGIFELYNAIKNFATGSLDEAKKFESAAQSLRGEVTMTDEQFKALKKSAQENGEAFGMTGEQMLKAYNAIASGKSDLIDVKGGIEAVTDAAIMLATNGEMQLEESAKVMTSSLNQFGAEAKDAAKFVDILSTGTIVGAGKIQEIGQSLKYVGPIAKAAGLSFGETNAALQILAQNGIKGEQAGTALRGMLAELLKGAKDTNPSIVGMSVAMENLAKKQLSANEMMELFGRESVSAGIAIVSNSAKLKEWTTTIEKGGGAAAMYAEKTKTVEFAEKQAAAAFANSRQEIGEKLLPIWVSLINFFTEYGIPSIQAVATGIIAVIQGLVALPKFIAENKELFIGLGLAVVSLNTANIAAAASALYMAAAEKGRAVVTKASAAAQWLLNAAMTANPIGLVIAAIATFTGGIVWAYKNVDWFRAGIQATWAGLKEFLKMIWDVNVAFYKLDFSGAWNRIKNGWSSVSKASGDAYANAMAESNKRVSADTVKTAKKTGEDVVKVNKEAAAKVIGIDKETAKERETAAKKLKDGLIKANAEMLKEIEKANDLADKNIRKSLEEHVKAVKTSNAAELKAHEKLREDLTQNALKMAVFQDAAMKLERIKKADSLEEIEAIEKEYNDKALKRELDYAKITLQRKEKEFKDLKALGALTKEEEDKRSSEILKLKNEVAEKEIAILKKGVEEKTRIQKDEEKKSDDYADRKRKGLKTGLDFEILSWQMFGVSLKDLTAQQYKDLEQAGEDQKKLLENKSERLKMLKQVAYDEAYKLAQNYISNAGEEIDALISKTTDKVEKARLESRKISNEMGKSFIDTVASFATGDVSGGISGLIGVLSGAVELFNQNSRILVAELEVLYDKLSADANFLMSNVEAVKGIYGDMAFAMPSFEDYNKVTSAIEASISAEIKVGQQIKDNYELAMSKENDYFEQRKKGIEDAYALDVQRINDKYDLLAQKAGQAQSAESLALLESGNNALLALITNEDSKTSIMSEYNKKRSDILKATALADMQITDDMDAATVKAINDARDLRDKSLADLAKWYQQELVFIVNNEGQKRREYAETDKILNNLKDAQDALDLKYAMDAIQREKDKTQELVKLQLDKNTALETEAKRHNDALAALGIAKDEALTASFNRLKEAMNSGYQEMIDNAERLYQKGIITANQFVELVNQIRYFKSLLNDGGYTDTGNPADVPYIEPIVIPKFASGTEFLDPEAKAGFGTDKVLMFGDRGERILDKNLNALLGGMSNEELVRRAIGGVRTSNAGLVNRINSSAVAGFGFAQPTVKAMQKSAGASIAGQSSVSNVYNNSTNFSTEVMEQLLGDIHRAIVDKPVLDMGTLNNASNAVAVNVARSRFA